MSKAKNKTQELLVKAAANDNVRELAPSPTPDFNRNILRFPNPEQAAVMVGEHAGLNFDMAQPEQELLTLELAELDEDILASKKYSVKLDDDVKNTPQYIKSCGDKEDKNSFSNWGSFDQFAFVLASIALMIALVISAANVYANLINSGDPIYIEQPLIAVFISLLAPAGSIAVKFISHFFDSPRHQKRYTNGIFLLTGLSFFAWVVLFSLNYSGATSGMDWDDLGESSSKGSMLVFIQLFAEILVGGALFLAAQDIYSKYSPDIYVENIAYLNAVKKRDDHAIQHESLCEKRRSKHLALTKLKAERQAFINEKTAAFVAERSRLNALNHF